MWVIGGVDVNARKCFLEFLPSRSKNDILKIIKSNVLEGTIIHTDCLKSYNILSACGFEHYTVNHSRGFKTRQGVHTNWIEGMFGVLKKLRRKYDNQWSSKNSLIASLSEFKFRYIYEVWNRKYAFTKTLAILKYCKQAIDFNSNFFDETKNEIVEDQEISMSEFSEYFVDEIEEF